MKTVRDNHYDAFISYRHLPEDKKAAIMLQNLLEKLKVKDAASGRRRQLRVFRDQSELYTSNDLGANIRSALSNSEFLIIVYSQTTKESKWCMEELNYFRSLHENTNSNVLPLILEGEPNEVFPDVLKQEVRQLQDKKGKVHAVQVKVEPIGADIRGKSIFRKLNKLKKTEYMRIAAPILGCGFDDLYKRNHRRRVRMAVLFSGFALVVCFLVFLLLYRQRAFELTEAAIYSSMAEQQEEKGEWQEALMYYSEAIGRDSSLSFEASSAMLLLQERQWPCITRIDKSGTIANGVLEPSVLEAYERIAEPVGGSIRAMDSTAGYYLVGLKNDDNQYAVYNTDGIRTAVLESTGNVMYDSFEQDYWAFYRQDGTVTLYNPAEDACCAFTIEKPTAYSGLIHVIPAGKDGCLVLDEAANSLSLYQVDFERGCGTLLSEASLSGMFEERYSEEMQKYGEVLLGEFLFLVNPEQNIVIIGRTVSTGSGAWSDTIVLRLSELTPIMIIADDCYDLNQISICTVDSCFALVYGNDDYEVNAGGYVVVYDLSGNKKFCTDINREQAYYGAAFRNDGSGEVILWKRSSLEFWNYETGTEYAAAVNAGDNAYIRDVVCTEDAHCIALINGCLYYYNITSFSAESGENPVNQKYNSVQVLEAEEQKGFSLQIEDRLVLRLEEVRNNSGDVEQIRVLLCDLDGDIYDELEIEHDHPEGSILEECPIEYTYSSASEVLSVCIDFELFYRIGIAADKPELTGCRALDSIFMSYICCPTEKGILSVTDHGIYYCDNASASWEYIGSQQAAGAVVGCVTNWNGRFLLCIDTGSGGVLECWDLMAKKCISRFELHNNEIVSSIRFLTEDVFEYETERGAVQIQIAADIPDMQAQSALKAICGMTLEDGEPQCVREVFDGNLGNWSGLRVDMR